MNDPEQPIKPYDVRRHTTLFGKAYIWVMEDGILTLKPDLLTRFMEEKGWFGERAGLAEPGD